METKNNLNVDKYNRPVLKTNDLINVLLSGNNINYLNVNDSDDIILYKKYQTEILDTPTIFLDNSKLNLTYEEFHNKNSDVWIFPEKYKKIDVLNWLLSKCKTKDEVERVNLEYKLFEKKGLVIILQFFIYLVDYMREKNCIWGVGRGSSVSSYILYIIGIHKVNSIKYGLKITDYLKDEEE